MEGRSLLAVFAHPDDESFACGGLLALSAERGVRTSLLCLTRGEHGPGREREGLAETRSAELSAAAKILGIHEVRLLDHEDGMLPWIDPDRVEADVRDAIRDFAADAVVTFDADGLYWHPDHIAVHERVTAAVDALGDDAPELWYVTVPPGAMRAVVHDAAPGGLNTILGIDADTFGADAPEPTMVVSAGALASRKLDALRCHRTQVEGGPFDRIAAADAERLVGTEHYRRAPVRTGRPSFVARLGSAVAASRS